MVEKRQIGQRKELINYPIISIKGFGLLFFLVCRKKRKAHNNQAIKVYFQINKIKILDIVRRELGRRKKENKFGSPKACVSV
jgi:hypothetical protein